MGTSKSWGEQGAEQTKSLRSGLQFGFSEVEYDSRKVRHQRKQELPGSCSCLVKENSVQVIVRCSFDSPWKRGVHLGFATNDGSDRLLSGQWEVKRQPDKIRGLQKRISSHRAIFVTSRTPVWRLLTTAL